MTLLAGSGCLDGRGKRPCDKHGTPGCTLVAHLSARRQAAFARWRCYSCGRFIRAWGPSHCTDCLAEHDRKAANLG